MKKKQKLFLGFAVLVMSAIFTIIGCTLEKDDNDKNGNNSNETTVDSRLWAESGHWIINDVYNEPPTRLLFTKNTMTVVRNYIEDNAPIPIYTKDNKVYRSDNDKLILTYITLSSDDDVWENWAMREQWANKDYTMTEWAQMGNVLRFKFPLDAYNSYIYRLLQSW
jgi:hypothetical protein